MRVQMNKIFHTVTEQLFPPDRGTRSAKHSWKSWSEKEKRCFKNLLIDILVPCITMNSIPVYFLVICLLEKNWAETNIGL